MWLDVNNEPDWGSIFQVESRPAIVFLKHGKRNRYVVFDGEWTEGEIEASIDKILGGDGKFKQIKGGLPTFSARKL